MIKLVQDWTAVRKLKAGLLDALRQTRPGAGITVRDPHNPLVARAIIEILREHSTDIEAMDHGDSVTLQRKVDMHKSVGVRHEEMVNSFDLLTASNLTSLGLDKKAALPAHALRGDIDYSKFNGDGPQWDLFEKRRGKKTDDLAQIDQSLVIGGGSDGGTK